MATDERRDAPAPTGGADGDTPSTGRRKPALWVEEGGGRRPFMRGIMVHSLMARGVSFEEADHTANAVREKLRGRQVVPKTELATEVRKRLGEAPFQEEHRVPLPPDIVITGKGRGNLFSKGVLSQSFLAAALDPHEAFDVAREIEHDLVLRGVRELARGELRRLSHDTLARKFGPQSAQRYLLWRNHHERDRPVILLLGGAPGVGKTALALEVAHRLGIPRVLSSDSVRQIMRIMLSPALAPAIHGSSYEAYRLLPPGTPGDDPLLEGFRAQVATVSVGLRASIDRALAENASMILEGVSAVPGLLDLESYRESAHVIFLSVATLDPDVFANRFAARAQDQVQRGAHRYVENLDAILKIQDYVLEAAERYGVPIVDNDSFDRAVLSIIRHVTESLRNAEREKSPDAH